MSVCCDAEPVRCPLAQDVLNTELDHDKYLYDMSDFVLGGAPEEADNGFRPPVPPDPSNPAQAIETCLTIDARCVGEPLGSG